MVKRTNNNFANAIELNPDANIYINCEPEDDKPPVGFIDSTVHRGRLRPDGSIEWYGTQDPFPEGWDDPSRFRVKVGMNIGKQKGEEEVVVDKSYDWPAIVEDGIKLIKSGKTAYSAAVELRNMYDIHLTPQGIQNRIESEAKKQGILIPTSNRFKKKDPELPIGKPILTPEPEPVAVADPELEITVTDVCIAELERDCPESDPPRDIHINIEGSTDNFDQEFDQAKQNEYHPSDNDFSEEDDKPIPFVPEEVPMPDGTEKLNRQFDCFKLHMVHEITACKYAGEIDHQDRLTMVAKILELRM